MQKRSLYLIGHRLAYYILIFLGVTILIFMLTRLLPGDPARLALGPEATAEQVENLRIKWGLNQPLYVQYWTSLVGIFTGDWGFSFRTWNNVWYDISIFAPASYELTTFSITLAILVGIPLGVLSASHKDGLLDHISRAVSLAGVSFPRYWTGIVAQIIICYYLRGLFPIVGRISPSLGPPHHITGFFLIDSFLTLDLRRFWDSFRHILLPASVLCFPSLANIVRLTRSTMIDQMSSSYVYAFKASGLPDVLLRYKYMLKATLPSIIPLICIMYGNSIGGTPMVEYVFMWPGVGSYLVDGIWYKDFNIIQGVVILSAILVIIANVVSDILLRFVDPRLRRGV